MVTESKCLATPYKRDGKAPWANEVS